MEETTSNNKTRMTWQFLTSLQPRAYIHDVEKTYQKEARDISKNIGSHFPVGSEESLFKLVPYKSSSTPHISTTTLAILCT